MDTGCSSASYLYSDNGRRIATASWPPEGSGAIRRSLEGLERPTRILDDANVGLMVSVGKRDAESLTFFSLGPAHRPLCHTLDLRSGTLTSEEDAAGQ